MKKGQKFILQTFNGTTTSRENCEERENYWKLVNEEGIIVNDAKELDFPDQNRVLFLFNVDVKSLGLECHNETPNALWVLKTDLKELTK